MSKANLKLADAPANPKRSPERKALAVAIDKRVAATERLAAIKRAITTANEAVWAAQSALDTAQENIAPAKAAETKALVDRALGKTVAPTLILKQARAAVAEAEDRLESAGAARDALQAEISPAEQAVTDAKNAVDDAVGGVIAAAQEIAALFQRWTDLNAEIAAVSGAMSAVSRRVPKEFESYYYKGFNGPNHHAPLALEWKESVAALETDPDAPLPTHP